MRKVQLGPRGDSADSLRRRITGLPGPGRCRHEERHRLWNQTARKTMFICLAASQTTSWATATLRRSAAITRRNRPGPNLAAPTWPSNSCVSICAGTIPAMSASGPAVRPAPASRTLEFAHEKTADYVEAGYDHTTKSCGAVAGPERCPVPVYRDTGTVVQTLVNCSRRRPRPAGRPRNSHGRRGTCGKHGITRRRGTEVQPDVPRQLFG